jgi:hypothetical protein
MRSTSARTMKWLRDRGFLADNVERYNAYTKRRNDWCQFADIIAIHEEHKVWFVQTTSGTNHASHFNQMVRNEKVLKTMKCGGKVILISWSKRGKKGKRKLWTPRIVQLEESDMIREDFDKPKY